MDPKFDPKFDDFIEQIKDDSAKVSLVVKSMLLVSPGMAFVEKFSKKNQILILSLLDQKDFTAYFINRKIDTDHIELLPSDKIASWLKTMNTAQYVFSNPEIAEKLIAKGHVAAEETINTIISKSYNNYITSSISKLFETCLYYIDPEKSKWKKFENICSIALLKTLCKFYSNKIEVMGVQIQSCTNTMEE
jgi:hypothetical protein